MKKLILLLLIAVSFSCSDSSSVTDELTINGKLLTKAEMDIYAQTGCIAEDPELIEDMTLFTDTTTNYRYLYGSKKDTINNITSFWVSKFEANGDCIYDLVKENTVNTYAGGLAVLSDGNLVVSDVYMRVDYPELIYETIPTVISQAGSITGTTDVPDGYIYTDVSVFDDFFFCTINKQELQNNPFVIEYAAQIRNNGTLLKKDGYLNFPNDYAIWNDEDYYVEITDKLIKKWSVNPIPGKIWDHAISLPSFYQCDINASFKGDEVTVNYSLLFEDGDKKTYTYRISYISGFLL